MKTYMTSDLHIGYPDSDYISIKKFFNMARNNADELIICGDTLDLWRCDFETISTQEPYKIAYQDLLDTASQINTIAIPGNHDYNIGKYLKDTNITVKNKFSRDGIFYMHGHELDILQLAASPYYGFILEWCPYLYQKLIYKPPVQEIDFGYSQIDLIRDVARGYAKKKGVKYLVHGHSHKAFTDGVVFDCGCYGRSFVVVEDGVPELKWN